MKQHTWALLAALTIAGCASRTGPSEQDEAGADAVVEASTDASERDTPARCPRDLRAEGDYCVGWRAAAAPVYCAVWGGWSLRRVVSDGSVANQCTSQALQVYDRAHDAWHEVVEEPEVADIEQFRDGRPETPSGIESRGEATLPDGTRVGVFTVPSTPPDAEPPLQTWIVPPRGRAWQRSIDPPTHEIFHGGASISPTEVLFLGRGDSFDLSAHVYTRARRE